LYHRFEHINTIIIITRREIQLSSLLCKANPVQGTANSLPFFKVSEVHAKFKLSQLCDTYSESKAAVTSEMMVNTIQKCSMVAEYRFGVCLAGQTDLQSVGEF
jgi:hypothetical protein